MKNKKVAVSAQHPVQLAKGIWIHAEDSTEAIRMLKAADLCGVLWEITSRFLRDKLKYGSEYTTVNEALEAVQQAISDEMYNRGINLDELYK